MIFKIQTEVHILGETDEFSLGKVGFEMPNGGNKEVLRGVCLEFRTVILTKEARLGSGPFKDCAQVQA